MGKWAVHQVAAEEIVMQLPLFVCEEFDVTLCASVHEAESGMEAQDILRGEYVVFDCQGEKLQVGVRDGWGVISESATPVYHAEYLKARLIRYVSFSKYSKDYLVDKSLAELVEIMKILFGYSAINHG